MSSVRGIFHMQFISTSLFVSFSFFKENQIFELIEALTKKANPAKIIKVTIQYGFSINVSIV